MKYCCCSQIILTFRMPNDYILIVPNCSILYFSNVSRFRFCYTRGSRIYWHNVRHKWLAPFPISVTKSTRLHDIWFVNYREISLAYNLFFFFPAGFFLLVKLLSLNLSNTDLHHFWRRLVNMSTKNCH